MHLKQPSELFIELGDRKWQAWIHSKWAIHQNLGFDVSSRPVNLIIGGYDKARLKEDAGFLSSFSQDKTGPLMIAVRSVMFPEPHGGDAALSQAVTVHESSIDSHRWLPEDVCNKFADFSGLIFDKEKNFYLINDTARQKLQDLNLNITFEFGNDLSKSHAQNTTLPSTNFRDGGMMLWRTRWRMWCMRRTGRVWEGRGIVVASLDLTGVMGAEHGCLLFIWKCTFHGLLSQKCGRNNVFMHSDCLMHTGCGHLGFFSSNVI